MADSLPFEELQQAVSQYNIGTFESEEPYDLIASIDDELTRSRLKRAMRNKAREIGFPLKDFDEMCKGRLADQKRSDTEKADKLRQEQRDRAIEDANADNSYLTGLVELLDNAAPNFGEYTCSSHGIFYLGMTSPVKVCSHPLFPTKRSVNIETGSELINVSYRIDNQWKTAKLIDRKIISQSKLIPALSEYGMDITSENAKEVVKYLADIDSLNRDIIPRSETVNRLGWISDRGFSPYIPGVTYDSGGNFKDIYSSVHEKGSFETWKRIAGKVIEDKRYIAARIVLAASVASVLLPWTCNQSFFVDHWSPESGIGKSVSSMLGASVWGYPRNGHFVRSMNMTAVGFEQTAAFCNNLPMFLDERETLKVDAETLIYNHCEGTGKGRGARNGGLREQTRWLNIAVTTGEHPLTISSKMGANNRVVSIESHGQVIPGDMTDFALTILDNYGFAGKMIVEELQNHRDQLHQITMAYKNFSAILASKVTSKQANYGAALLVGDWFLDMIVFGGTYRDNLLNTSDILPFLATPGMIDIHIKIRNWLISFVVKEDAHFIRSEDQTAPYGTYGRKQLDGSVLIIAEVLKEELMKRDWNYSSFMRWCYRRNYIKTNYSPSSRHWDIGATVCGQNAHVIHFLPIMFQDDETEQAEQMNMSQLFNSKGSSKE